MGESKAICPHSHDMEMHLPPKRQPQTSSRRDFVQCPLFSKLRATKTVGGKRLQLCRRGSQCTGNKKRNKQIYLKDNCRGRTVAEHVKYVCSVNARRELRSRSTPPLTRYGYHNRATKKTGLFVFGATSRSSEPRLNTYAQAAEDQHA